MNNKKQWEIILNHLQSAYYIADERVNIIYNKKIILSFNENDSPLDFLEYIRKEALIIPFLSLESLDQFPFEIFIDEGHDQSALEITRAILYSAHKLKTGLLTASGLKNIPPPKLSHKTSTFNTYYWDTGTDIH